MWEMDKEVFTQTLNYHVLCKGGKLQKKCNMQKKPGYLRIAGMERSCGKKKRDPEVN